MILSLVPGDLHQRPGGQAPRTRQYGAGDRDLVVPRQAFDNPRRSIGHRRKDGAEFGLHPAFDACDEMAQNVVETLDLLLVQALRVVEEKVRDLPKRFDPLGGGAASDGLLQFINDRNRLLHHDSTGARSTPLNVWNFTSGKFRNALLFFDRVYW